MKQVYRFSYNYGNNSKPGAGWMLGVGHNANEAYVNLQKARAKDSEEFIFERHIRQVDIMVDLDPEDGYYDKTM